MPETAENVAELLNISRTDQDAFALRSPAYRPGAAKRHSGAEIVPVLVPGKRDRHGGLC